MSQDPKHGRERRRNGDSQPLHVHGDGMPRADSDANGRRDLRRIGVTQNSHVEAILVTHGVHAQEINGVDLKVPTDVKHEHPPPGILIEALSIHVEVAASMADHALHMMAKVVPVLALVH